MVATSLSISFDEREKLLLMRDPKARLDRVNELLAAEVDVLELEDEIHTRVQSEVDRSQREFYLREQMKAIQTELGEGDVFTRDINELRQKLDEMNLPEEAKLTALKEMERLNQMPPMAPEVGIIRTYIDWILNCPGAISLPTTWMCATLPKCWMMTITACKKPKTASLSLLRCVRLSPKKSASRFCALWARRAPAKHPSDARLPKRWDASLCASRWAACAMKPKSAVIAAPTSARYRDG